MLGQAQDKQKFYYVWRKDLGYYVVNIDNPYWDAEKKQMRHRYTMVGKSRTKDGPIEFGPKYRARMAKETVIDSLAISRTTAVGEYLVLKETQKRLKIASALSKVYGKEDSNRILALASYSVCTGEPLSYAQPWLADHGFGDLDLEAPRISELLGRLNEDLQNTFFKSWLNRRGSGGTFCYDITSVSSHGKNNDLIEWGYNRDGEKLQQVNLALLSGRDNGLPLWYTPLSGSLNDSKSLTCLVDELEKLECGAFALVMDRGFYSKTNINYLVDKKMKFMIPIPNTVGWHKKLIREHRGRMFSNVDGYIPSTDGGRLLQSVTIYRPFEDGSRGWVHIYYDSEIRSQAEQRFMEEYKRRYDEFASGNPDPDHLDYYEEYFKRGNRTGNGQKVLARKDPVKVFEEDTSGYWCIHTNAEKDAQKALSAYRSRGDIEQLFDDLKNTLDCNRLRVHTKAAMQGRLFIQFIALILLTELKKMIAENSREFIKYGNNHRQILRRVASYSRVKFRGKYNDLYSTPTKAQELIFTAFGIDIS
jgi:hypothetical protein